LPLGWLLLLLSCALFVPRDAPAHLLLQARVGAETILAAAEREARVVSWAAALRPIDVAEAGASNAVRIRLYDDGGDVDDDARATFERVLARDSEAHALAPRVEQLVFKAAYRFGAARVILVSGWRERAGRHATGEAVDFRLAHIPAAVVAAYLRGLPRVGVGVYTNPGTQFVHLDVREPSYHWLDASPPGVHWKERQIVDRAMKTRDAAYQPEMDLPEP
jgi:uncharacterized protein YcbK (DUF882 family)